VMDMSLKSQMERYVARRAELQSLHALQGVLSKEVDMTCGCGSKMEIFVHAYRPPTWCCMNDNCFKEVPIGGEYAIKTEIHENQPVDEQR